MDRRNFFLGVLAVASSVSMPRQAFANEIVGGGFIGGSGAGNIIIGDETTARDAMLDHCIVNGRGAAISATARSSSLTGDACGMLGHYELADVTGQYAARAARLKHVTAKGYAVLEYGDAQDGLFSGLYSGHSCFARMSTGTGQSSLYGAIVERCTAHGTNAGYYAEGYELMMIGMGVTTALCPGEALEVSDILIDDEDIPWVIKNHNLGSAGQRVNLIVTGDDMPDTPHGPFINGQIRPFTVLDANTVQYTGNKFKANTKGFNVKVAINTCRPKRSTAIGSGSLINRDDQFVLNGRDVTGLMDQEDFLARLDDRMRGLEESERLRGERWWPFN